MLICSAGHSSQGDEAIRDALSGHHASLFLKTRLFVILGSPCQPESVNNTSFHLLIGHPGNDTTHIVSLLATRPGTGRISDSELILLIDSPWRLIKSINKYGQRDSRDYSACFRLRLPANWPRSRDILPSNFPRT